MKALLIMFMFGFGALFASPMPNGIPVFITNSGDFKGDKGDKGDRGDRGFTGRTGNSGATGSAGDDGSDGFNGIDGADGSNGTDGTDGQTGATGASGTNGTNGMDGVSASDSLSNKLRSAGTAMDSVELNPDHHGLSVGIGGSTVNGYASAAVGIMYVFHVGEANHNVGINVKAYKGEGDYHGAGAGITIGF